MNSVSAIIPFRDREIDRLFYLYDSFDSEDIKEFIVVDYGSKNPLKVEKINKNRPKFKVIRSDCEIWNKAHALNIGIKKAIGDFIMTIDLDIVLVDRLNIVYDENCFYYSSNVRRINKEDLKKGLYSKSFPWYPTQTYSSEIFGLATGGLQVYSKKWIKSWKGIDENLVYAGGMDNITIAMAKKTNKIIIQLPNRLLHIEHDKQKADNFKNVDLATYIQSQKRQYLNEWVMNPRINDTYGNKKPNCPMYDIWKQEFNKKNIVKIDQTKKILIAVISNQSTLQVLFVQSLMKMFNYTSSIYPNAELRFVRAAEISNMRNLAVKLAIEGNFDNLIQLDSVTPETPILIKRNGFIDYVEIQSLFKNRGLKLNQDGNKVYSCSFKNIEVYTRNGWKKINYVMKHYVNKPIYHIDGDCVSRTTGDHSLFKDGKEIKPTEIIKGDILDKVEMNDYYSNNSMTEDYARLLGFFCAEGTCGKWKSGKPKNNHSQSYNYIWNVTQNDISVLEKYKIIAENQFCRQFKIETNTKKSENRKGCYRLVPNGERKDLVELFLDKCTTKSGNRKIPQEILNSNTEIINAFLDGYIEGDGSIDKYGSIQYSTDSYILAAGLSFLYNRLGKKIRFFNRNDKPNIITTKCTTKSRGDIKGINKILKYDYDGDVYDICTEDGTFVGGCGNLLFKNTDHELQEDTIIKLMAHDKDFVTVPTKQRVVPFNPTQYHKFMNPIKQEGNFIYADPKDKNLIKCEVSGPVCMLMKVSALRKLKYPYYRMGYENKPTMSSDFTFCKQVKKKGFDIYIDQTIDCPHIIAGKISSMTKDSEITFSDGSF